MKELRSHGNRKSKVKRGAKRLFEEVLQAERESRAAAAARREAAERAAAEQEAARAREEAAKALEWAARMRAMFEPLETVLGLLEELAKENLTIDDRKNVVLAKRGGDIYWTIHACGGCGEGDSVPTLEVCFGPYAVSTAEVIVEIKGGVARPGLADHNEVRDWAEIIRVAPVRDSTPMELNVEISKRRKLLSQKKHDFDYWTSFTVHTMDAKSRAGGVRKKLKQSRYFTHTDVPSFRTTTKTYIRENPESVFKLISAEIYHYIVSPFCRAYFLHDTSIWKYRRGTFGDLKRLIDSA